MKTENWALTLLICLLVVQEVLLGLLLLRINIIGQQTQALYNLFRADTGPELRIEQVVENVSTKGRPYKGSADAPVTIVEFSSFSCPACAMVQPTLKELLAMREGQVRLVFRHFPPESPHSDGFRAAVAAECAAQQGVFWEMHDTIFANAEALSENDLLGYAAGLGLDEAAFAACLDSDDAEAGVRQDILAGQE
jgi:protein-disulfide isomerase